MMKLTSSLLACALSVCTLQNALAAPIADSQIKNVGFRLIDLDTQDGITPELLFTSTEGLSLVTTYDGYGDPSWHTHDTFYSYSSADAHTTEETTWAAHGVNGHNGGYFTNHFAQSTTISGMSESMSALGHNFTLTPHTRLEVFGDVQGFAKGSAAIDRAHSETKVELFKQGNWNAEAGVTLDFVAMGNQNKGGIQHFELSLNNDNLDSLNGSIGYRVFTYTDFNSNVPSVPEPETWGMMALGLFGLAAVARRRRQG